MSESREFNAHKAVLYTAAAVAATAAAAAVAAISCPHCVYLQIWKTKNCTMNKMRKVPSWWRER